MPDITAVDVGLFAVFVAVLIGPFLWKKIEHNLEAYLFICGAAAATVASVWSWGLVTEALEEPLLKGIVPAVLIAGLVFHYKKEWFHRAIMGLLKKVQMKWVVFLMVVCLGLISSVITAIIAALLLVEVAYVLPLDRRRRTEVVIICCFSIGLGAVLTPLGEPLSTIAIAALDGPPYHADFFFFVRHLAIYVVPGVVVFGAIAYLLVQKKRPAVLERLLLMKPHTGEGPGEGSNGTKRPAGAVKETTKSRIVPVRVSLGYEMKAAADLAEEVADKKASVTAILLPAGVKGYLMVETESIEELGKLIRGVRDIKELVEGSATPEELAPYLMGPYLRRSSLLEVAPGEGELITLFSGPYRGQTARVLKTDGARKVIHAKLLDEEELPTGIDLEIELEEAGKGEADGDSCKIEEEPLSEVFVRGGKVYLFVMALILLGGGMKVLIDKYFVLVPPWGLYWVNIVSAVLDNATLTAAEIGPTLAIDQIKSALMGLLVAGGILIPGNIPNIIAANKLKIGSKEWASLGIPLGLGAMLVYFLWLYLVPFP